ncbi:hypothetical protein AB0L00_05485 [Actinoallomurus sp. NPDC052308]
MTAKKDTKTTGTKKASVPGPYRGMNVNNTDGLVSLPGQSIARPRTDS